MAGSPTCMAMAMIERTVSREALEAAGVVVEAADVHSSERVPRRIVQGILPGLLLVHLKPQHTIKAHFGAQYVHIN